MLFCFCLPWLAQLRAWPVFCGSEVHGGLEIKWPICTVIALRGAMHPYLHLYSYVPISPFLVAVIIGFGQTLEMVVFFGVMS